MSGTENSSEEGEESLREEVEGRMGGDEPKGNTFLPESLARLEEVRRRSCAWKSPPAAWCRLLWAGWRRLMSPQEWQPWIPLALTTPDCLDLAARQKRRSILCQPHPIHLWLPGFTASLINLSISHCLKPMGRFWAQCCDNNHPPSHLVQGKAMVSFLLL